MKIMNWKSSAMMAVASAFMLSSSAWATPVGAGTFNLTGSAIGSLGGIVFYFNSPGDMTATIAQPTLGQFAGLASGTHETIQDLTTANGVTPGTPFNFQNWIQLSDNINLDATSIPIPAGFSVCPTSGAVANGFECLVNAASPVILTQGAGGVSARVSVFGNAHFVGDSQLTPFSALLNSPSTNFATLADFETYFNSHAGGIPAVSFSGSFTTTPVPEPASLAVIALGLIGCGFYRRRSAVR
jgi:PEP-CTERM motif